MQDPRKEWVGEVRLGLRWAVSFSDLSWAPAVCLCRPEWRVSEEPVPSSSTSLRIGLLRNRYPGTSGCPRRGLDRGGQSDQGMEKPGHSSPCGPFCSAAAAAPGADLASGADLGS